LIAITPLVETESIMLTLHAVRAGYGATTVLHDVDLSLGPGLHTLLGPNGAGKTTLFRVAAGVLSPWAGRITIGGRDPQQTPTAKAQVGYLTHRPGLAPEITVRENLEFWHRLLGRPPTQLASELERIVCELELSDILARPVRTLSRGQAQRASIARALLADPLVVLCDEPTTGLDPMAAVRLRKTLRRLSEGQRLVLYSTHNLYEAAELTDQVLVLAHGQVKRRGSLTSVTAQLGSRRRYGLRTDADPSRPLDRIGCAVEREGPFWVIECQSDAGLAEAVQICCQAGVRVFEARALENPLELLYQKLASDRAEVA